MRLLLLIPALLTVACSAARHTGPPLVDVPPRKTSAVTVILEPFFEQAQLITNQKTETAMVTPMGGGPYSGVPQNVTVTRQYEEKPLLAQVAVLTELHARVLYEVKRRRPEWNVQSTGVLQTTEGPVTLVRTIVGDPEVVASNRTMRNMAFGFGIVIPPLLILAAGPVEETQRVFGALWSYETDGAALRGKLIRYPTQPDYAVDTRGLKGRQQRFGLDIMYEEGVFAAEASKDPVLIEGFALQLAGAVIAIVEGY